MTNFAIIHFDFNVEKYVGILFLFNIGILFCYK